MPVLFQDPDKKKKEEQAPDTNIQVLGGSKQGSLGGSPTEKAQGTRSGSFTNLQSYLKAAEGTNMGRQVAGQVQSSLQRGGEALGREKEAYRGQIAANTVSYTPERKQFVEKTLASPVGVSEEDISRFQGLLSANYAGPRAYEYNPASENIRSLEKGQQYAEYIQSPDTLSTLLQDLYYRPQGYTSGQRKLDTLLTGATLGDTSDIQSLANQQRQGLQSFMGYSSPTGEWVPGEAEGLARSAAERSALTGQQVREALGISDTGDLLYSPEGQQLGALGAAESDILAKANLEQQKYLDEMQAINSALSAGNYMNLSPELRDKIGFDPSQQLFGIDRSELPGYLNYASPELWTKENVTSPEDYARLQALSELAGLGGPSWSRSEQLPSGIEDPYNIKASFWDALTGGKSRMEQELATTPAPSMTWASQYGQNYPVSNPMEMPMQEYLKYLQMLNDPTKTIGMEYSPEEIEARNRDIEAIQRKMKEIKDKYSQTLASSGSYGGPSGSFKLGNY